MKRFDVVIVGGGAIGLSTALYLSRKSPALEVAVIEPDPHHRWSESGNGSGGVRQLFTCPENILLSQFTVNVVNDWENFTSSANTRVPDLGWRDNGYLFLAGLGHGESLQRSLVTQMELGVAAEWLDRDDIAARYPLLAVDDLEGGVLSTRDGWHSSRAFVEGLRLAVEGLENVVTHWDRVVGLEKSGSRIFQVHGELGGVYSAETFVNTAGCWAPMVAEWAGMPIPVEPMRRHEHVIDVLGDVDRMPFIKDFDDLAIRPGDSSQSIQLGRLNWKEPAGFNYAVDGQYFASEVQQRFMTRYAGLEECHHRTTWSGLYDRNTLDRNLIIGNYPGVADNFFIAAGLSGHGLMHAPGIGRALAELVLDGQYGTIDLDRFGYQRILEGAPYAELGIV